MIKLNDIIERFDLELVNDNEKIRKIIEETVIQVPDINRLSLQLTGYFDFFDKNRIQIVGKFEHSYIEKMSSEERLEIFNKAFHFHVPAFIMCRGLDEIKEVTEMANKYSVPILRTNLPTTSFKGELIRFLKDDFSPCETQHGVLIDIYGEGVLILGESGIGKSETALELVKRGHRMVADDAVKIKKLSSNHLEGTSPEIIRYFMELRGIGVIDIREMFGVESVKESQKIDLVIKILHWDNSTEYDRLGLENAYYQILGVDIPCYEVPVRPGRNLAIICEVAAINCRKRKMGYNAADVLNQRVLSRINSNKCLEE